MAGDGQVTLGHEVLKASARKLRRFYNDRILAGFAGSTADAFALFARFETQAGAVQRQSAAPRRGAGQGVAHGPRAAPPGGAAAGGRREEDLHRERQRRRDRAGRRRRGRRLRRPLRQGRGAGAAARTPKLSARRHRRESPWRSPARSASTPTRTSPTRSWASHGHLSSQPVLDENRCSTS